MSYKTILAVMESPAQQGGFLDFTFEVVRSFDAHLIGLHAEAVSPTPIVAPMDAVADAVKARYDGLLDRVGYYLPFDPQDTTAARLWQDASRVFGS